MQCMICESENLEKLGTTKIEGFATSDRKKFTRGEREIEHVICKDCGTIQFLQNEDYRNAVDAVFQDYDVMHCKMWSMNKKEYRSRLLVIYEKISETGQLSDVGNMLDIGCGGGESLQYFSQLYPEWSLYGMDIGEHFRKQVICRHNVKQFYASLEEVKDSHVEFDFITTNDVLCIAGNAAQILETAYDVLTDGGILFVKDTDFEVHPWILYNIDTCFPYTKIHMKNVLRRYGFSIIDVNLDIGEKSIGVFCKKENRQQIVELNSYEQNREIYYRKIEFLNNVIEIVEGYLQNNTYVGIFGTSIAGVWLSEIITKGNVNCTDKRIFYIEEDEEILQRKVGVNGYPILSLEEISEPAIIFLPFPEYIAENIKKRCEKEYAHLKFISFK